MTRPRTALLATVRIGLVVLVGLAGGLAGCSASPRHHAAEPADAPTATAAPAGTVRTVGALAEGAVFDARTGLLAVAVRTPDRLVLLDGRTLAVRASVPLPGHARHLQLLAAGGPVLVPAEDANRLLEVGLPGGGVVQSVPVGKQPHDAAPAIGGRVMVGDELGSTLSVITGGRVERTISGPKQPGGVVDTGALEAVVDVHGYTVGTYDPATGKRTAVRPAGAGPTHAVLVAPNRLVVIDTRGGAALVFSVSPLRQIGRLAVSGSPYGVAVDPSTRTVWVTLTGLNQVVGLDVSTSTPRVIARYATVEQPNTVAVAPGSHTVWVVGSRHGQVERITR